MQALNLNSAQIIEIMKRLPHFQELDDDELWLLQEGAREIGLRKKEILFHQGEPADALFIVVSGQIKLSIGQPRQQEKVVGLLERGQSCGEIAVFLGEPCPNTAQATEDSYVLAVSRETLQRALNHKCQLAGKMLQSLCRRMHDLIRDIDNCYQRSSTQRVACYLLQHRPERHIRHYEVNFRTSKHDIATLLSLTPETFSRALQQLSEEGCVRVIGRNVHVLDADRLQSFNGLGRRGAPPTTHDAAVPPVMPHDRQGPAC